MWHFSLESLDSCDFVNEVRGSVVHFILITGRIRYSLNYIGYSLARHSFSQYGPT